MHVVLLVRYLKKEILIDENHKYNSANSGQTGTKYDSIRQKIARNLQKPHYGTNYFCSACERNNNNNKVSIYAFGGFILCTLYLPKNQRYADKRRSKGCRTTIVL